MSVEPTTFIVIAVVVITFIGTAYGLKTRKGSGINEHPDADTDDPARMPEGNTEPDRADSTLLDQHGKT